MIEALIAKLTGLREEQGLTIMQAARRAGLSYYTVRSWEIGKSVPRVREAVAYADALGYVFTLVPKDDDPRCLSCNVGLTPRGDGWAHLGTPGCDALIVPEHLQ